MSILLTEEQELIGQSARDFAKEYLEPIAAELDHTGRFPAEVVKQLNRRLSELEVGFCVRNRRACVRWDAVLGALTFGRLSQR